MKRKQNEAIPIAERWKKDPIKCDVTGYTDVSVQNQIKANRSLFDIMVKQGVITKEGADIEHKCFINQLYEELGMLVAK